MTGTLSLSWGKWGGFYRYRAPRRETGDLSTHRLCVGWFAITYIGGIELDDLMEAYADEGAMRDGVWAEVRRLRSHGVAQGPINRERDFTAARLAALLASPPVAESQDEGWQP